MNRTTTMVVALIAAAGLSTMVYAVLEQRAMAWGGGFCFGFGGCDRKNTCYTPFMITGPYSPFSNNSSPMFLTAFIPEDFKS
jgi:hypothetical protein